jgi:hypothetical protein
MRTKHSGIKLKSKLIQIWSKKNKESKDCNWKIKKGITIKIWLGQEREKKGEKKKSIATESP